MAKCRTIFFSRRLILVSLVVTAAVISIGVYSIPSSNRSHHLLAVPPEMTTIIPTLMNPNNSETERKRKLFNVEVTKEERTKFMTLIQTFSEAVPLNVTYFLYSGTLLGSYRHHGMIPWDDDLDLLVKDQDKYVIRDHLSSLSDYELNTGGGHSWKFFNKGSLKTRFSWRWPFLDLFFYLENKTSIWDSHPSWRYKKYLKSDIFPLTKRPFMGLLLPAPRNTKKVLSSLYDMDICETKFYDHKREKFMNLSKVVRLPCKELQDKFPFVRREYFSNKILETLEYNSSSLANQPLSTYTVMQ